MSPSVNFMPSRERTSPAAGRSNGSAPKTGPEFDLHGWVGVRLVDAAPGDVAAVARQLGPIQAPLARPPEIVVRFVDRLPIRGSLRYLGLSDVAFSDDAFFLLKGKHKARVMVQLPVAQIGQTIEIVCESGVTAVPLLIPILNLTALARGVVPLHAAAFIYHGTGVLVTGWSKGGKTEALLAFMAHGAEYVGDEWVYLDSSSGRMAGIPEPIRLWDWHLQSLPEVRARVAPVERARLRSLGAAARATQALGERWPGRPPEPLARARPLIERQRGVQLSPQRLFGAKACRLVGPLDQVVFVASHAAREVRVEPISALEIARRMVFSLQHERLALQECYLKFRFAFPEARNPLLEQAETVQRDLLTRALAGTPAWAVYHPYPVSIPALFDAMVPHVG
jgi:hypothetical protein